MPKRETLGWVLYDDSCGFCRRWVPFWAATLRKRGFEIAALRDGGGAKLHPSWPNGEVRG